MKPYLETLFKTIEKKKPDVIYLEGGYHELDSGPNEFSLNTLKDSIILANYILENGSNKAKIVLGIFVNDLNDVHNDYAFKDLPSTLKDIFTESKIFKEENVLVFKEKKTKNRGKRNLKKSSQAPINGLIEESNQTEKQFYASIPDKDKVYIGKSTDNSYSIFCPWIMSQHYFDIAQALRNRYHTAKDFFITDWIEMLDKSKVLSGAAIFKHLLAPHYLEQVAISINNVFFADDAGEMNQIKTTDFHND